MAAQESGLVCFVKVNGASGLKVGDIISSDPYCVVSSSGGNDSPDYNPLRYKTETVDHTLTPKWKHAPFVFKPWKEGDELLFEIWDDDKVSAHDFLGQLKYVPTRAVDVKGNGGHLLPLQPRPSDGKKHGVKGNLDFTVVLLKVSPTEEHDFLRSLKFSS